MSNNFKERLSQIRAHLAESDEAFGPSSSFDTEHEEGEAGESGAVNVTDVNDVFDAYISAIVGSVLEDYDISSDDAVEWVFDVAASLEEDGTLPPIPDEDEEIAVAEWVGKAKTMGFAELVFASLEAAAEEEEADEE